MPRYYFHLVSDGHVIDDDEGVELRELSAAHGHALRLQDQIRLYCPEPPCDWIVKVSDHTGASPLVILPRAVPPSGAPPEHARSRRDDALAG
jgi:hypothetical protein